MAPEVVSSERNVQDAQPVTAAARVAVIGQGYVGLPLAMRATEVGFHVVGYEVDGEASGTCRAGAHM